MKINPMQLRAEIIKASSGYKTQIDFFKEHGINRNWLYTCMTKGEIGKNVAAKLISAGVNLENVVEK